MSDDRFEVWAWIGEDEYGSGEVGLKQGFIPTTGQLHALVSIHRHKIDRPELREQLQAQAGHFGKRIRLVRLVVAEEVAAIEP